MGTWRFSVGNKGCSRITVFERPDATSIFIEWWDDDGRHRQALSTAAGAPLTDREKAKKLAKDMAARQERHRNQTAATILGLPSDHTLKDLLERRHADLADTWSAKYKKSREIRKRFWLKHLKPTMPLVRGASMAGTIEKTARAVQQRKGYSDRWRQDVLRYLVDSFIYAEKKLKWIEPRHNLSAVDIPRAKGRGKAYTEEEGRALVRELYRIGPLPGWLGHVAFATGRRIGAIRQLTEDDVSTEGEWTQVTFPVDTDKAGDSGTAVVKGLPERTDWRVPSYDECKEWLEAAQVAAGVPNVKGRLWHGYKRLYATMTEGMAGRARQAGTREDTLRAHYEQDTLEPKLEVAEALAGKLDGG